MTVSIFIEQPKLVGMSSLPLKDVLTSDMLYMDRRMKVADRSKGTGGTPDSTPRKGAEQDWPVIGQLVVRNFGTKCIICFYTIILTYQQLYTLYMCTNMSAWHYAAVVTANFLS